MVERELKHIADQYIGSLPHCGIFIFSPNTCVNLKGNIKSQNSQRNRNRTNLTHEGDVCSSSVSSACKRKFPQNVESVRHYAADQLLSSFYSKICSDMTCVCLLSNRAALSSFIWLSATYINVSCIFGHIVWWLMLWPVKGGGLDYSEPLTEL
jgi:hypothetical protein